MHIRLETGLLPPGLYFKFRDLGKAAQGKCPPGSVLRVSKPCTFSEQQLTFLLGLTARSRFSRSQHRSLSWDSHSSWYSRTFLQVQRAGLGTLQTSAHSILSTCLPVRWVPQSSPVSRWRNSLRKGRKQSKDCRLRSFNYTTLPRS